MFAVQGEPEAAAGDDCRQHKRQCGQGDVVGDCHARLIGQHGDEVGGPDAPAGRNAREPEPKSALAPRLGLRPMEQADRHQTGQETHHDGQDDQPPIMRSAKTLQNSKHGATAAASATPMQPPL